MRRLNDWTAYGRAIASAVRTCAAQFGDFGAEAIFFVIGITRLVIAVRSLSDLTVGETVMSVVHGLVVKYDTDQQDLRMAHSTHNLPEAEIPCRLRSQGFFLDMIPHRLAL